MTTNGGKVIFESAKNNCFLSFSMNKIYLWLLTGIILHLKNRVVMKKILLFVSVFVMCSSSMMSKGRFKGLREERQEVRGLTTYITPYLSHLSTSIVPYIVESQNNVWFKILISYSGHEWIFFDEVYLKGAGESKQILFTKEDKTEKVFSNGDVLERIDIIADDDLIEYFRRFKDDPDSKVYFVANGIEKDHRLMAYEKRFFNNVISAYEVLVREKGNVSASGKATPPFFQDVQIGMSMDEVKKIERNALLDSKEKKDKLIYNGNIYGKKCLISYVFENNELKSIVAFFISPTLSPNEMYDELLSPMIDYYGEPLSSTTSSAGWIKGDSKINLSVMDEQTVISVLPALPE